VLTVGSLFAGIGGFDLAAARVGMDVRWAAELDQRCRLVLGAHFPSVRLYQDVKEMSLDPTHPAAAEGVDVLCGGFPCQDVSVAGNRSGLAGERSGLFYEFARLIEEGEPTWVVIENVPGLLSSNGGRDMGAVLGTLGDLGYGWAYRVLDAQHFGVPQRRRRVFIVGCLGSRTGAGQVLFEPEGSSGHPAPGRGPGASTATGAEERSGEGCSHVRTGGVTAEVFHSSGRGQWTPSPIAASLLSRDSKGASTLIPIAFHPTQDPISSTGISHAMSAGNSQGCATVAVAYQCHGTNVGPMGTLRAGNGPVTGGVPFVNYSTEEVRPALWAGSSDGCASAGGVSGGTVLRRLTPTECERLQGFDDDWTDVPDANGKAMPDSPRYRMLGNTVAVPVVEWVLGRLAAL